MLADQVEHGAEPREGRTPAREEPSAWTPRGDFSTEAAFAERVAALGAKLGTQPAEGWTEAVDTALAALTLGLDADAVAFYRPSSGDAKPSGSGRCFKRACGRAGIRGDRADRAGGADRSDPSGVLALPDRLDLDRLPDRGEALVAGHAQRTLAPDTLLPFAEARRGAAGSGATEWVSLSPSVPQRTHTLLMIPCAGPEGVLGLLVARGGWATQRGSESILSSAALLGTLVGSFLERHRLVAELARRRRELDQADRLATLGQVASSVAHDFNNLLTAIGGNAELLEMILPEDAKGMSEAEEISEAVERATHLVEEMLSFSRTKENVSQRIQLPELVHGLERMTRRVVGNGIEVVTDLPSDLPCVELNPGRFERLLLNLASNARDAQPSDRRCPGRFELSARHLPAAAARPSTVPKGDYVRLRVADDGCGIDPAIQDEVFDPFFTTKPEGQGTGLGLATCAEVMREVGGAALIESSPGEGTAFDLYFPVAAPQGE